MWRPAYNAATHHVYFGTSKDHLTDVLEVDGNVFTLPSLSGEQTVYWRVDTVMPDGSVAKGDVWSFTTAAEQ